MSDDMARGLTFMVLVLADLALIFANRSWRRPSWARGRAANASFGVMVLAASALLAAVLGIPALAQVFAFALPPTPLLLAGAALAALSLLWFEAVKSGLGRRGL
jgi:Ca2+-transporting ATPase